MPPSRLIIDLNRCFEPNPFNTGPPIPKSTSRIAPSVSSTLSPHETKRTPDLSSSPSSTTSSSLSLPLEDDEIKKIFRTPENDFQPQVYSPTPVYGEDLNPKAAPFVPSFALSVGREQQYDHIEPSPLDLGFNINVTAFPPSSPSPDSPYLQSVPLPPDCPPGLSYPPQYKAFEASSKPLPPPYAPLFPEAFRPGISIEERETFVIRIINSILNWDIDDLLELAEDIASVAGYPASQPATAGYELAACDVSRYLPVEHGLRKFADHINVNDRIENIVAVVSELFHLQFLRLNADLAQMFVWNLRESILMKFIHCWDPAKPHSIKFHTKPPAHYVRSALALSKAIPAMFKHNLIGRDHVRMCISILLKDLMSIEHFEALSNLVLGCGPSFWGPTSDSIYEFEAPMTMDSTENTPEEKIRLNSHVTLFLAGLEANLVKWQLTDEKSVLRQPWGTGQLAWRVQLVVDSVNLWEAVYMAPLEDES